MSPLILPGLLRLPHISPASLAALLFSHLPHLCPYSGTGILISTSTDNILSKIIAIKVDMHNIYQPISTLYNSCQFCSAIYANVIPHYYLVRYS